MKYNKSEIMKRAWSIRKSTGCDMSTALRKSWSIAKLEIVRAPIVKRISEIENQRFFLAMTDRWTRSDYELNDKLFRELFDLKTKLAALEESTAA